MSGEEQVFVCRCERVVKDHHLSIACDICDKWYHVQCVGMSNQESEALSGSFMCKTCSEEGFMVDGADWHVESANSTPLPLPESSSSEEDESSDEDEAEENLKGTTWGRVLYDDGSSFWGERHDGNEYLGAYVEAGPKGKAKMVKWEERDGQRVMLKILWEDIDYAAAQEARRKAQAAVRGDADDGDGSFMYDEDAAAGDGANTEAYQGGDEEEDDGDGDDDDDLQLEIDGPEAEQKRKKRRSRDIAQPGAKRVLQSSRNGGGPAFKKRRKEKQLAKARAKARAEAALRKSVQGPADLQKLRTRVIGKLGEALEVNKAITAKALQADQTAAAGETAASVPATSTEQTEPTNAEQPGAQNSVENKIDDEPGAVRETQDEKDGNDKATRQAATADQNFKEPGIGESAVRKDVNGDDGNDKVFALAAAVTPLGPGAGGGSTGAPEKAASTATSATQEEPAGSEVSADKNDVRISSKLLAARAREIEIALYEMCGEKVSMQYKQSARNLAHNLADLKNDMLRIAVLKGEIVGATLVRMNASELANPDAQKIAQRIEENKLYHSRKIDEAVKDGLAGLELPSEYNRAGRRVGSGAAEQAENDDLEEATLKETKAAPKPAFSLTARLQRPGTAVGVAGLAGSGRSKSNNTTPRDEDVVNHRPKPKAAGNAGPKYIPAPAWKPPSAAERAAAAEKLAQAAAAAGAAAGTPPPPPAGWDDVKYSEKRKRWYYRRRSKKPSTRWVTDEEMASGFAHADPDQPKTTAAHVQQPPSSSGEVGWTAMHSTKKKKWYIVNLLDPQQRRWVGHSEAEARQEAQREEDARLRQEQQMRGRAGGQPGEVVVDLTSDAGVGTGVSGSALPTTTVPSSNTMYSGSNGIEVSKWLNPTQNAGTTAGQYSYAQPQHGRQQHWGPGQTASAGTGMYSGNQQPVSQYGYSQQQPYYHQTQHQQHAQFQQQQWHQPPQPH